MNLKKEKPQREKVGELVSGRKVGLQKRGTVKETAKGQKWIYDVWKEGEGTKIVKGPKIDIQSVRRDMSF